MKETMIQFKISAFGTVSKRLVRELEEPEIEWIAETIQTTALFLRSARILRRVHEISEDLLSLKTQRPWWSAETCCPSIFNEIPSANTAVKKNSHRSDNDDNNGQKTRPNNNQQKEENLLKLSTLLSWLTTEWNWKNVKRRVSTSTLIGNWKNYGTWRWQL